MEIEKPDTQWGKGKPAVEGNRKKIDRGIVYRKKATTFGGRKRAFPRRAKKGKGKIAVEKQRSRKRKKGKNGWDDVFK